MNGNPHAPAAVTLAGVCYTYEGGKTALEQVDLEIPAGRRLGIFGPNGGGKSTLLKLILGALEPQRGRVRVFGLPPREAARKGLFGYLPQRHSAELRAPLSVRQMVSLAAGWRRRPWERAGREQGARVDELLDLAGIADLAGRPVGDLSGGQQQRAFIARALAGSPKILLLDEPTVGIDQSGREQFAQLLRRAHQRLNLTLLMVSHNLRAIASGCDEIAVLSRTLHYHATPSGLTPEVLAEVFHHDIALPGAEHPHP